MVDKKLDQDVAHFCSVTGASTRDARDFLKEHKRLEVAIDAYYNNPNEFAGKRKAEATSSPSTSKLARLFDQYKDEGDEILINGTIKFCEDLQVDPEDVVLLAVACELKSPGMGRWTRQEWIDGWKHIGADAIPSMQASLHRLREQLATDPEYFKTVYNYTFNFSRSEGQRSLGLETAEAFWNLLLPLGLKGGSLTRKNKDEDVKMGDGWQEVHTSWWLEFLRKKGGKGVSKDTWVMFLDFVRSIDSKFSNYDIDAAWPSLIDDFVDFAREKISST
ncbi:defective in Cullin neddylation protein 1 [Crepidotus variabilis]|uniref:Defective in cullin neddylation protein n=1 Tax=Crepidotus variabilis TaxID=179855 RepID=A0A9P6JQR5_9AGAR|nr:defective in Cullin neddylation protein 1 [Crepidotus variabilis]